MNPQGPNPAESPETGQREERIGQLINEFFDRVERGETLSAADFLAEHADEADALREHLLGLELLADLGGSSKAGKTFARADALRRDRSSAEDALGETREHLPRIPGYEIHKQIGRGGMGVVFKATQRSTKRVVALKLLLEGPFAAENSRKRFEREIALAAQLRHPNIIPIYDSGTAEGRMYYAMEYIYGLPLGDYLRQHAPDTRGKLRIFLKICSAISHAHQRGVIHRDLKPSNILVDAAGEPHLLDFGLAKAGSLADATTSLTAQIVGTPAYMSPEQAAGDPSGIDVRTDVYSLGVVLYEALTGKMPYETNVAMGKILHNIAHADPVLPSRLNAKIDGEVDAILLKALEKHKDNRYQSVDGLSTDIQRYLDGQPIFARPPDAIYLLRKAVARHRGLITAGLILLLVGAVTIAFVRRYTHALALNEQQARQIRQKEQEKRELEATLKAKEAAQDEVIQRQQLEEARKQTVKLVEKQFGKEVATALDALASGTAKVIAGEDAAAGVAELAAMMAPGLARPAEQAPLKKLDYDPAEAVGFSSPKPADLDKPPTRTPAQRREPDAKVSREDLAKALELLARQLRAGDQTAAPAASSQPASAPSSGPAGPPA